MRKIKDILESGQDRRQARRVDRRQDRRMDRLSTGGNLPASVVKKAVKTGGPAKPMVKSTVKTGGVLPPKKSFNSGRK